MIERSRAALLFLVLALVMTWPLALHLDRAVTDPGDPLLNTWIMAWDLHKLGTGSPRGLFDANIFFPNHRTLAYSEHLLPQALLAALPTRLAGNPIVGYNCVLLLALASSALGMYVLARHLTGSEAGAVFAGIAFAFSPFMMGHLSHLQVLCAGGLPLSFYFLHRFLAGERDADVLWLALTIAVQMLANGYYAVLLPYFIAVPLLGVAVARRRLRDRRFV
ncbi:MAG TPA: glycosyltransferase family 39 protein, partial [Thermoanaerobaculaceae bacterium]|nr:glycosyltransferase family 39 protein [Thermoanaerobaculaceae bacterium]